MSNQINKYILAGATVVIGIGAYALYNHYYHSNDKKIPTKLTVLPPKPKPNVVTTTKPDQQQHVTKEERREPVNVPTQPAAGQTHVARVETQSRTSTNKVEKSDASKSEPIDEHFSSPADKQPSLKLYLTNVSIPVGDLLDKKKNLVTTSPEETLGDLLYKMDHHKIITVPIFDGESLVDIFSILDVVNYLADAANRTLSNTVSDIIKTKTTQQSPSLAKTSSSRFIAETELDVVLGIFSRGVHRIIVGVNIEGSRKMKSFSQKDCLKFLVNNPDLIAPANVLSMTVGELNLVNYRVDSVRDSTPCITAFKLLASNGHSAVPVVDENDHLVSILSAGYLRNLGSDKWPDWKTVTTKQFLESISKNDANVNLHTIGEKVQLNDVMKHMTKQSVGRYLYIINSENKLTGYLSLTSIFALFSK